MSSDNHRPKSRVRQRSLQNGMLRLLSLSNLFPHAEHLTVAIAASSWPRSVYQRNAIFTSSRQWRLPGWLSAFAHLAFLPPPDFLPLSDLSLFFFDEELSVEVASLAAFLSAWALFLYDSLR